MPTTSNFGWTTPADTDLVKDGALAIRTLGNGIDTSFLDLKGGTTDQVLAKNSNSDLDFKWVAQDDSNAIQNAIVDAKGDLISATAADTPARLAVGANGTVLTADSGESTGLKWAAPASGGYTELATGSLSGSDLTLTSISGSYIDLRLYLTNIQVSAATNIKLQINGVTASTYAFNALTAVDAGVYRSQASSNISTGPYNFDTTGTNNSIAMEFRNYAVTNALKTVHGVTGAYEDSNNAMDVSNFVGTVDSSAAITSLKVFPASGTFTGTYKLYGVK